MAGLPKVMQRKKDAMKEEHPEPVVTTKPEHVVISGLETAGNPGGDPSSAPSVEVPAPVEETLETKPLSLEEQWKIESEGWEHKYRTLQGVVDGLEPKLRSEKEAREKLEQELQNLRDVMPKPVVQPDPSEELTEEELQVYGASAPVIQKIAKKIAKGELEGALKDLRKEIKELKEASGRVETGVAASEEDRFISLVRSNVTDFDKIIVSKEWQQYLNKPIPYTDMLVHQALANAHANRKLEIIKDIFKGFKPSKSALESMRSPTLGGSAAPVNTSGNQKPMLKWSDRQKISQDFKFGRIPKEERDKWDKLFKEAAAENRIDYDK